MHTATFFNIGNADSTRITLDGLRKILFDYANTRDPDDEDDPGVTLPTRSKRPAEPIATYRAITPSAVDDPYGPDGRSHLVVETGRRQ